MRFLEEIEDIEVLQTLYDYLLTVNKASTQSFSDWFGRNPAEYELYCRMPEEPFSPPGDRHYKRELAKSSLL